MSSAGSIIQPHSNMLPVLEKKSDILLIKQCCYLSRINSKIQKWENKTIEICRSIYIYYNQNYSFKSQNLK